MREGGSEIQIREKDKMSKIERKLVRQKMGETMERKLVRQTMGETIGETMERQWRDNGEIMGDNGKENERDNGRENET